uniref:uncharacterized protein n=1 Tax=Centroberyx gerrardi TaxID=166262 RepID=UPI003AAFE5A1
MRRKPAARHFLHLEEEEEEELPETAHTLEGDRTTESFISLQSRSKAELVAMVMSMQREMDSLREQIRCLTAGGKLARTLESLVERTEEWSSSRSDRGTTSPIMPLGRMPAPGQWTKPDVSSFHHQQPDGNCRQSQLSRKTHAPPLHQERLASHGVSGSAGKRGRTKPALPAEEIQAVLRAVQHCFPGKTDSEIKGYIRQKLQNEAKRLRKKPRLLIHKEAGPAEQGEESSTPT